MAARPPLPAAVQGVGAALAEARYPLDAPGAQGARERAAALRQQLDDYLVPRLARLDAPLLVVVGGSTGAGKSTLVNSLVGEDVSPAGVLRPTTRRPVVVCSPDDAVWFDGRGPDAEVHGGAPDLRAGPSQLLPALRRALDDPDGTPAPPPGTEPDGEGPSLGLVVTERLPPGVALLDAPDVDSVVDANRALARRLLAAADLWLFVTTAARYADAVPWALLRDARDRGASLAVVCDRAPPGVGGQVADHLRSLLAAEGLGGTEVLVVPETTVDAAGLLPDEHVAGLRERLVALALDADARSAVVRRTLLGALGAVVVGLEELAAAAESQEAARAELAATASSAFERAALDVRDAVRDGTVLRGEVLARWTELVGVPDLARTLQGRIGRARDRMSALVRGEQEAEPGPARVGEALVDGVAAVVVAAAGRAARDASTSWDSRPDGRALLTASRTRRPPGLEVPTPGLAARAEREVEAWRSDVMRLVAARGSSRRTTAAALSWGVNGTGLAVMLAVFTQTGGLTGAEVAVAGGTSAVGGTLLQAVLGDQVLRGLVREARDLLLARAGALLDDEQGRYADALAEAEVPQDAAERLRGAAQVLRAARGRERAQDAAGLPGTPGSAPQDVAPVGSVAVPPPPGGAPPVPAPAASEPS